MAQSMGHPAASPSRRLLTPGIGARRISRLRSTRAVSRRRSAISPGRDTGTFSYAAHVATVAVDPETGDIEILDYVIVEDGGKLINPMVVDGQIYGGFAQGVGTALYEEMNFDSSGQPLASTFADYLLPGPTEVPAPRVRHMETLSPFTEFGVKGLGEGGAIAPPAAIGNAINDALRPLGAEVFHSPTTPRRVLEAIAAAKREKAPVEFEEMEG